MGKKPKLIFFIFISNSLIQWCAFVFLDTEKQGYKNLVLANLKFKTYFYQFRNLFEEVLKF